MANYTKLAQTAKRLIEKNGKPLTLRKRSEEPADTDKPWRGSETAPTEVPVIGVILSVEYKDDLDGVRRAFANCLIAALSANTVLVLTGYDELVEDEVVWQIVEADPLHPGTVELLTKLRIKK